MSRYFFAVVGEISAVVGEISVDDIFISNTFPPKSVMLIRFPVASYVCLSKTCRLFSVGVRILMRGWESFIVEE